MIILYEENEKKFESLGLGVLKDAISPKVSEKLNDSFEFEMEYPITGKLFKELRIDRIICCKTNPYDSLQPFRIYSITKPLNGTVTVSANHISYDMNGIPVTAIDADNLTDAINKIQNGWEQEVSKEDGTTEKVHKKCVLIDNPFKFNTDIFLPRSFKTTAPYNLRAILMGGEESLIGVYGETEGQTAELKFNKFNISILKRRGANRGARVIYGHNMTDLNHEIMSENLYNGIFPYYHSEKTSNETSVTDEFKQVYIVGTKPFASDWLSYTEGGEAFIPISNAPVQVATDNEYKDKIYAWNETTQRYEEKIYNEQVNLIKGVFEPTWVTIDWTKFPTVTCRANKVGYFKKVTDTDWGDKKGVGDIVFSESLIGGGIMQNIMLCFSEVIPSDYNSQNEEVSEIIDVVLDDPIIKIETQDTRNMLHDRILNVDLSSEFEETPTQDKLRTKAIEYIKKNKIGIIKHNTTVSFIDLASTTDADMYKNFDHIELGDTVNVEYQDLGVDVDLRVISTVYDVSTDRYDSIELGDKEDTMSSQNVQAGDNISSLSNDAGYTDVSTVNKLIAQTVTAEFIEAVNARISKAAIKQLEAERINVSGIIEASQFNLDTIIAKLLTADNAEIKKKLKAGEIEVAGDVSIKKGDITIESEDGKTSFKVDRNGNVTGNSMTITGGNFDIGDGNFTVDNDGTMYAKNANIEGNITAETGKIGAFYIVKTSITTDDKFDPEAEDPIYHDGQIYITPKVIQAGTNFSVDDKGSITTKKGKIGPLEIENKDVPPNSNAYEDGDLVLTYKRNNEILFKIDPSINVPSDPTEKDASVYCKSIKSEYYIFSSVKEEYVDWFIVSNEGTFYLNHRNSRTGFITTESSYESRAFKNLCFVGPYYDEDDAPSFPYPYIKGTYSIISGYVDLDRNQYTEILIAGDNLGNVFENVEVFSVVAGIANENDAVRTLLYSNIVARPSNPWNHIYNTHAYIWNATDTASRIYFFALIKIN